MGLAVLEPRLQAVANEIRVKTHADIGSDHALLPKYLLQSGRVRRIIAIEKNRVPFEHSRLALAGFNAEVRLGNGLEPLQLGEADSVSLCGMGAKLMVKILSAHPQKLPARAILQSNDSPQPLREWALNSGFHLVNEQMVEGFWCYSILSFERHSGPDPVYDPLPRGVSLRFGPILLQQKNPLLYKELLNQQGHLRGLLTKGAIKKLKEDLECVEAALSLWV